LEEGRDRGRESCEVDERCVVGVENVEGDEEELVGGTEDEQCALHRL